MQRSNNKYFLYVRKSSESEDKQVLSIDSQINELTELARRLGLDIVEIFKETKSAKAPGRPVFNEMIERLKREHVAGILCWKVDRLARNPVDGGTIIWAIKEDGISIVSSSQTYTPDSDTSLLMYVEFGMAQKYVDDLSKNVKRGLKMKLELGWYPFVAPQGYLNTPDRQKGYKIIVNDSERFHLVRKMWDLILTGSYTVPQILFIANNEWGYRSIKRRRSGGNPISRSCLYEVFTNPFYYGEFEVNGTFYKGSHSAMISYEEFEKVQVLLGRKGKPRPQKHLSAFTGFLRCSECNCFVTATHKAKFYEKTKNLAHYDYYHCTRKNKSVKCTQPTVKESDMDNQMFELLMSVRVDPAFKDWALTYLSEIFKYENKNNEQVHENLYKEEKAIKFRLNTLFEMRLNGEVTEDEYKEKKVELEATLKFCREKIGDSNHQFDSWLKKVEEAFNTAERIQKVVDDSGNLSLSKTNHTKLLEIKELIQRTGSNFFLNYGKVQYELKKPFYVFKDVSDGKYTDTSRLEPLEYADMVMKSGLEKPESLSWLLR